MSKPHKTWAEAGDQIAGSVKWTWDTPVTYSFRSVGLSGEAANDDHGDLSAFQKFTSQQIAAVETAMGRWSELTEHLTFQHVYGPNGGAYSNSGNILFGNYTTSKMAAGGFMGGDVGANSPGAVSVWLNDDQTNLDATKQGIDDVEAPGATSRTYADLYLHEIGHALGLDHPGNYDSSQPKNPDGTDISYANNASYFEDSGQYSVMSYWWEWETGASWTVGPTTPMLHDIAAVQALYGVNTTTRHGDSTYGFHANTGAAFSISAAAEDKTFTIWDTGGHDTLDMSGYSVWQILDLRPEHFSSTGMQELNIAIAKGVTIEDAIGGSADDTIYGNNADNELWGNAGNDKLYGLGGEDVLYGGANDDTYTIDVLDSVVEAANQGLDTVVVTFSSNYAIPANVENLYVSFGSAGNVIGNGLANKMVGNISVDTFAGAIGDDYLVGDQGDDKLNGGDGKDVLDGGLGGDEMQGGADDDFYYVDSVYDKVIESSGQGDDVVLSSINYTMPANVNQLYLIGSATNGYGSVDKNTIYGNSLDNIIDGKGGADTMVGAAGNDTYYVDNPGDMIIENAGQGDDVVNTSVDYVMPTNVNRMYLTGSAVSGTGSSDNNTIYGNASDNVIDGKGGADSMQGGGGNDYYFLDVVGDHIVEAAGQGTDVAFVTFDGYVLEANVEVGVVNTATGRTLYGNAAANTLHGGSGNDTLNGKGGADAMLGHGGDDWYYVDNAGDTITESASEGAADRAFASVNYTLGTGVYVEKLTSADNAGTGSLTLTGNELGNTIYGNAGSNAIYGMAGNDTLVGMGGPDAFVFNTALNATNNVDNIGDFNPVDDGFVLAKAIFSGIVGTDLLPAGGFYIGSAAHDADDRIVYNSQAGVLYYDADGTGGAAAVQFATLAPGLALTYADFMLA